MTDAYQNRLTADDVAVGDTGPELVVADVEREDFVKYAGASGDFNPIHYDEPHAIEAGNESVFGQGMLTAAYAAHFVADWFGIDNITRYKVRFLSRLLPGETLVVSGEIIEIREEGDETSLTATVTVTTRAGTDLLTGEVVADLPAE